MNKILRALESFQTWLGYSVCCLSLAMVLVMAVNVILRYCFNMGWIALQETVVYLHASLFMLGSAYTLSANQHVRVDIFYRQWDQKKQAWINLLGTFFLLLPTCTVIIFFSFGYVREAWHVQEASREAGGLPWVYWLKSLILVMPTLLLMQGLTELIKSLCLLLERDE